MNLIRIVVILFLLVGMTTAQLAVDKDKFELELHPGDIQERTITVENIGDIPIFDIKASPVGGDASEFIELILPEIDGFYPEDDSEEIIVIFAVPPEAELGSFEGYVYLFDDTPLSLPILIDFNIDVIELESYGVSFTINDAKSASMKVDAEELVSFDLTVMNTGLFRDVISIDAGSIPSGWDVELYDGNELVDIPYNLPLSSGSGRTLYLDIVGTTPGDSADFNITATSLGNPSKNKTVTSHVDLNLAVRTYNVVPKFPDKIIVNRTYSGNLDIELGVEEKITVNAIAPPGMLVIPESQVVPVSHHRKGTGEFTVMATTPGIYSLTFKLTDSNGVPMPDETKVITAIEPTGVGIIAGNYLLGSAALCYAEVSEKDVPVITMFTDELSATDLEEIDSCSEVIILGNESSVSQEVEKSLSGMTVIRIVGDDICETCWLFASKMWLNGTEEAVLVGPDEAEVMRAYQKAKDLGAPLVICDNDLTTRSKSIIENFQALEIPLSKVLLGGGVSESTRQDLVDIGLVVEEV
jgi:hypothetical protein